MGISWMLLLFMRISFYTGNYCFATEQNEWATASVDKRDLQTLRIDAVLAKQLIERVEQLELRNVQRQEEIHELNDNLIAGLETVIEK